MSSDKVAELLSSAEAAKQNFSTNKIVHGNCKECNCETFIRYHYDDGQPVPNAAFVITDSKGLETKGELDDNGLCFIDSMPCGGFELELSEGSDEFTPEETVENNPVLQKDPEYAVLAAEYFSLYTILRKNKLVQYDENDSDNNTVDVDASGFMHGLFRNVPDEYEAAYNRFWELDKEINKGTKEQKEAINKIYSGLSGELAGVSSDNDTILLFCQVALGFVPVVGQAMDLYDLGCWGWNTCEKSDHDAWHWASGALIAVGFVPGLGDAVKRTGLSVIDCVKKIDNGAIQTAIKAIRKLSNGNIVKYLKGFGSLLSEMLTKAGKLLDDIIQGLLKLAKKASDSGNWILKLLGDTFNGVIDAVKLLYKKLEEMEAFIAKKVDEFIDKIVTRKSGTASPKGTAKDAEQINAGVAEQTRKETKVLKGELDKSKTKSIENKTETNTTCSNGTEPIDLLSGRMFETRTDFRVSALLPVSLTRYYRSTGERQPGLLGRLWRSNWDITLEIEGNQARFVDYDYTQAYFIVPLDERFPSTSMLKPGWVLNRVGQDLVLKTPDGIQYVFGCALGATLKLSEIRDGFGHRTQFLYDRGTLKIVVLDDGRFIKIETSHRAITGVDLYSKERELLERLASYQYDKKGRLLQVRAAPGCNFDYQYDKHDYLVRWDDLARTWVEHDFDKLGRAIATRCANGFWNDFVHYDDDNHITFHKDALGGVVQYHLDERNRAIKEVAPDGGITLKEWDGENLTAIVNPLGERTEYTYDGLGNLTSVTLPSGIVHEYIYNGSGQLTAYTNPMGETWALNYGDTGTLNTVSDPDGRSWHYEYNKHGLRTLTKGPDGLAVRYEYDAVGQLVRLLPEMGEAVSFQYDLLGRLTSRTIGENHTRYWKYDKTAKTPSSVHYEDGTHASFEYDIEGNLIKVTDASGQSSRFTYGAFDKLKSATDPQGAVTQYHYNPLAEFAGVTNSQGNEWRYEFDECGRIHTERHYDGRKDLYRYDAAGRLNKHIKPDQHELAYLYNTDGQLAETHTFDPRGERTSRTWYEYDDSGRLIAAENGDIDVLMAYSQGGMLTKEWLGGVPLEHRYDSAGYRTQLSGTHTPRQFDWQRGQLSGLQIGCHQALNFAYNPLGLEQSRQTENGFNLQHDWDDRGRLQAQRLGGNQPYAKSQTLRNYHYDNLDRLVGIDDSHWGSERFELNNNGQITKRIHEPQKGSHYQYVTLFGYDSELNLNETASGTLYTDNVIPISQAALNKEQRQYDNAGRVVKTGRFTYHYDECGRAIQKIEQKDGFRPQTTQFSWDENDRLIRIELPNGERWRYRYDAFGRRVAKECERGAQSSQQVHYLYDGAQLIQQTLKTTNGEALQSTEYIYEPGSFRPVAQVNTNHELQTEKLHYIVNDHAGTPRELCTEAGEIVWRGEQGLWQHHTQKLQTNVKRLFEDAANDPVQCNLRYQGQLEDKESGLYYNLNRYYDADSGQYLSSDPIGMVGGLRPQGYVDNPMEWVDPLGLAGCPVRDLRIKNIADKHGGVKLDDGGYEFPNKRSAKQAASEIAGDLGSGPITVRRSDYRDTANTYKQESSNRVIGKISLNKNSGYYDHSIGHDFDRRPHFNVWSERTGTTAKDNYHLYY